MLRLAAAVLVGCVLAAAQPTPDALAAALQAAVRTGNLTEVKRLVLAGADVNARDAMGSTPLLDASWAGDPSVVAFLLAHGAEVNVRHAQAGATPLQYAVLTGRAAIVKLLLVAGARVDLPYRNGQTALHVAASRGNVEVVQLLIGAHASLAALDSDGNTALDDAVLKGRANTAAALVRAGADIRRLHADGRGPLQEACIKGFPDIARALIEAGVDPSQRDRSGQTPLDLAVAYKSAGVVTMLLRTCGGEPRFQAEQEEAMESAGLRGRTEIVKILIDSGFDINEPTAAGSTYLHDAALQGQLKVVQLLIARGARLDALNPH